MRTLICLLRKKFNEAESAEQELNIFAKAKIKRSESGFVKIAANLMSSESILFLYLNMKMIHG